MVIHGSHEHPMCMLNFHVSLTLCTKCPMQCTVAFLSVQFLCSICTLPLCLTGKQEMVKHIPTCSKVSSRFLKHMKVLQSH